MTSPAIPSPKGEEEKEAIEAANRIVSGWQRSLSQSGYWEEYDPLRVARALLSSSSREEVRREALEEAAKIADQYTRLSPLHNYGPAGASRTEKASMDTATIIAQEIRALSQGE